MKSFKLLVTSTLLLFITASVFAGKPVRRTWDVDANGNYDWSCNETPDYVEITCYASVLCKICPQAVNSTHCNQHGAYDPTDLLAMEEMFGEADDKIAGQQATGNISKSYWVEGEDNHRNYSVTWKLVGDQYIMEWERIEE
jgi:hypothetical protein